jgi:hypothetical protein
MTINKGIRNNYKWIESDSDYIRISDFIQRFPDFFIGFQLAIISFDSDSFIPTIEELNRGWTMNNEIAYYPKLTKEELNQPICDNSYDQWLLFERPQEIDSMDIYVNYTGFSMVDDLSFVDNSKIDIKAISENVRNRFWVDIERLSPSKFILYGDKFIFGTTNDLEIEQIINNWG